MRRLFACALVLTLVCMPMLAMAGEGTKTIGIIQYVQHVALDSAREGFVQALADNGFVDGQNIALDVQNAQADASNLATISDRFVANNVDLVLAIATPAAQSIAGKTTTIPILGTAITDYEVARLVSSNQNPGTNVSGTTDMNPVADQIKLIKELFPQTRTVGLIYTSSEDNSILQAKMAKEAVEAEGMSYKEVTVSSSNDVQQATQSIVDNCDAIYIPTDNVLAASISVVYEVTTAARKPVICGEAGMVEGGALATLGINYYDLGYQTGLMALRVLAGEDVSTMAVETASKMDYTFNSTYAEAIGFTIPEKYQAYAKPME
ncbi:MAG: ABC transporter substrate-binding protein [Clostridiales bacterium]|nr:ABC transporter substrate-binding protein [Clostridiales bacterium]